MPKLREPIHAGEDVREPIRAAEGERVRLRKGNQIVDPFDIPAEMIPDGMSVEWKNYEVRGQQNPTYDRRLVDQGWKPACKSMFPGLFDNVGTKGPIIVEDMMLYERPMHLTNEAKQEQLQMARNAVRAGEHRMAQAPEGTAERLRPTIRKSYEPITVPD